MSTPKLLIAYDGSPNARGAMQTAAGLFPGAIAVLLYARQPLEGFAAHLEGHPALENLQGLDAAASDVSEKIATDAAELARQVRPCRATDAAELARQVRPCRGATDLVHDGHSV